MQVMPISFKKKDVGIMEKGERGMRGDGEEREGRNVIKL